jgi:phage terminase large subunit
MQIDANFPAKLQMLFQPKRYKVLWGGRGAGRSWGCARALILLAVQSPLRVLCAREFQNSINDSVHKLLSDQITALGLAEHFEILKGEINGKNGSIFRFEGIKNNVTRIKSYEGIDICWVEEANKLSKNSWAVLIPTIRKPKSEIWLTFNPELDTDYTYQFFVRDADKEMSVVHMTYRDNPWFPEVLLPDIERDRVNDYDKYLNVWEGLCVQQLEGAVYATQLKRAALEKRLCQVPWDPLFPVDTYWDLGRADRTAIWFVQRIAMQWRLIDYYENTGPDIGDYLNVLQQKGYHYGKLVLPHDAKAKKLGMKMTIEEICRRMGYDVRVLPLHSRADGINAAKMIMKTCWWDEKTCQVGLQRLRHYRYRVVDGHLSNEPLHDDASDGADAFRYFAMGSQYGSGDGRNVGIKQRLAAAAESLRGNVVVNAEGRAERGTGLGWLG